MFALAAGKATKAISSDYSNLLPNKSTADSSRLQPLALVKKKKRFWFQKNIYKPTNFSLPHVANECFTQGHPCSSSGHITSFNRVTKLKVNGSLSGIFKDIFEAKIESVQDVVFTTNLGVLEMTTISHQKLMDHLKQGALDMSHTLLEQMSKHDKLTLCVVTSVVRTTADCELKTELHMQTSAEAKASFMDSSAGVSGGIERDSFKTEKVYKDTILAYEVVELQVDVKTGIAKLALFKEEEGGFGNFDFSLGFKPRYDVGSDEGRVHDESPSSTEVLLREPLENATFIPLTMSCPEVARKLCPSDLAVEITDELRSSQLTQKQIVSKLLSACREQDKLVEFSSKLELGDDCECTREEVLELFDIDLKKTRSCNSLLKLSAVLADLDDEVLFLLSSVTVDNIPLLRDIISKASSRQETCLQQTPELQNVLDFLLIGLDYQSETDDSSQEVCLSPPTNPDLLEIIDLLLSVFMNMQN